MNSIKITLSFFLDFIDIINVSKLFFKFITHY